MHVRTTVLGNALGNSIVDGMTPRPVTRSNEIGLTDEQYADVNRQVEAGYLASQGQLDETLQRDLNRMGADLHRDVAFARDMRIADRELRQTLIASNTTALHKALRNVQPPEVRYADVEPNGLYMQFDQEFVERRTEAFRSGRSSALGIVSGRNVGPYALTEEHADIRVLSKQFQIPDGIQQWDNLNTLGYALGQDIFPFKDQWVAGYREPIVAAANRYDLPPELIAGVVYNEVGGDPLWIDDAAFSARTAVPALGNPELTSFGNVSIQLRRAAESLGYSGSLIQSQEEALISSLEDPVQNIFIAAKHLADLRDIDFAGVVGKDLTQAQVQIVGTRYNRGPDLSINQIQSNLSYGRTITNRWNHFGNLLQLNTDQGNRQ